MQRTYFPLLMCFAIAGPAAPIDNHRESEAFWAEEEAR
jgi:hypothetical protein